MRNTPSANTKKPYYNVLWILENYPKTGEMQTGILSGPDAFDGFIFANSFSRPF
jgi:hypothetical protein